jgi:dipeptidase E
VPSVSVEFQINPHFTNSLPAEHQGETREKRIAEYLQTNAERVVVGLPEGDWLRVTGTCAILGGPHAALVFRAGQPPAILVPGQALGSEAENPTLLAAAGIGPTDDMS